MSEVHFILPEGVDDPARPSGGNTYDRRVSAGLRALGWDVHEHAVAGPAALAPALDALPDGAVVLLDGLIASGARELVTQAQRLRLVVLVHMPFGHRSPDARASEGEVLDAAAALITTSEWTRHRIAGLYGRFEGVFVAEPGADPAELAPGTPGGGALLCVAAVIRDKGHDVLLDSLATIADLDWCCQCVGSLDREPAFAAGLAGRDPRVAFTGPRTGIALVHAYAAADLLVLPSRAETYGMVITEALARGLPVIASDVGGVREALGPGAGLLVPPGDAAALGAALRAWRQDAALRDRLRRAARERRAALRGWAATAEEVAGVLAREHAAVGAVR